MATRTEQSRDVTADALRQPTLCGAFQLTAAANADRPALRTPDGSVDLSWSEYADRVRAIATGLASLGVSAGDTVGLMLGNRPEFHLVDTAALHLGATPFSVYQTNPAEQIVPLLANSGARVMVTEPAFLDRVLEARDLHPGLEHVIVVDGAEEGTIALDELSERDAPQFDFEERWRSVSADAFATIVYTSGTTGAPKGVQHTHAALVYGLNCMHTFKPVSPHGRVVSYLPMAHIAERYISHYASMTFGYTITCCADPQQLPKALATTRPTRLFGVPRIFEKLGGAVRGMAAADPGGPLERAIAAGLERVRAEQAGEPAAEPSEEDREALSAVRAKLGLDDAEWVGVAAAPSPRSMLELFHAIGIPLIEFWGMSECVFSVSNPPDRIRLGSIGIAVPGVEIDLADDGEILVRGPNLMAGYRGEPEKTAEAIDADGWLHSGDIAEQDEDGYLKVVDRKKELIINSAGKNMAPTKIELAVKEGSPLIGQVVAIGDRRKYVTALIVLDPDACARYAEEHGVAHDVATLSRDDGIREAIDAAVARGNEALARVEQVKAHSILPVAWAPGGDELTPTMKLKRRAIADRYADEIEALYGS